MYNILIVDDERIERNGIKFLLKQQGIELNISEATNGKEALEFLASNPVNILLTDVKMPFIDGIELIKEAAPIYSNMKMIIFSGYSEFEYAKFAMKMGVTDYILKPVDPNEFSKILTKVIKELDDDKIRKSLEEESKGFMKEHILYSLVNGVNAEVVNEKSGRLLGVEFANEYGRIMLLETNTNLFGNEGSNIREELENIVGERFHYLNLNPQQSLLFFGSGLNYDYKNIGERIVKEIENRYREKCYVAIGSEFVDGINQIANQFEKLESLMDNKFYYTVTRVFLDTENENSTAHIEVEDDTLIRQMRQDIKMKDIIGLNEHLNELSDKYSNQKSFSQIYIKFIFSNLLKDIYNNLPNVTEKELNREIDKLYCSKDFSDVMEIINLNTRRLEEVFSSNPQMVHREIESIKKYIYENYDKELSVDQLADHVYMAPSYLSHVFKKETGQNLSKYIKAYRMEKAKEMLEDTHNKIVNISYAVGYSNVSYFCQSFREYFGVSPQKFRSRGEINEKDS